MKEKDRDIDNDLFLLSAVKMFYDKNHEEKLFRWNLEQKRYSKNEIDRALSDYYWIYIQTPIIVNKILMPVCLVCVFFLIIFVVHQFLSH